MDEMIYEFDEVECMMIASGESLIDEGVINETDVEDIEDDDENDDYFDHTIEDIGATFTQEDVPANSFRKTRDHGMNSLREDAVDCHIMGIDSDVEDIEDDDDDEFIEDVDDEDF